MAHADFDDANFDPPLYLNPNEQDLLLTALNSNKPGVANLPATYVTAPADSQKLSANRSNSNPVQRSRASGGQDAYTSPVQQTPGSGSMNELAFDESPYLDYDLDDSNFDWEKGEDMFGALPGQNPEQIQGGSPGEGEDEDSGDKRKNHDDDEDEEGGGKRREGDDKTGKKPGRKPLTSEPTTKRKAQNRAAQRAFRERKERHLKELETKVEDLEKSSESSNHENGLLRAQVERLQTELREYRKRLSFSNTAATRTSPQASSFNLSSRSNWDINNNFQFAFPKFGLQGFPANGDTTTTAAVNRTNSAPSATGNTSFSTKSPKSATLPNASSYALKGRTSTGASMEELNGLFSPSILANAASPDYLSYPSTSSPSVHSPVTANQNTQKSSERALSESNTDSPASSGYHNGFSSCVTTPESSAESPEQRKAGEAAFNSIAEQTQRRKSSSQEAFYRDFQTACGNKSNPVPAMISDSDKAAASVASTINQPKTPNLDSSALDTQGIDWFASENGGVFDPVLFGDYRDPQDNIMNNDFGGFFNDAFPVPDFSSPDSLLPDSTPKKPNNLMKEIEDKQAGKEIEVVPGETPKQFLTCNMLWDRVQRSQRVQSGEADMDDLCSQLKAKAKCSGNGAVIDQKDVDAILGPAPNNTKDFFKMFK